MLIPTTVDYARPFPASDFDAWRAEYDRNVQPQTSHFGSPLGGSALVDDPIDYDEPFGSPLGMDDVTLAELADLDPAEREFLLAEMGFDPSVWQAEEEVLV